MNRTFIAVLLQFWIISSEQTTYSKSLEDIEESNENFSHTELVKDKQDQPSLKRKAYLNNNAYCKTVKEYKHVTVNCSHHNLTYIPKIGMKIDNLLFDYNNLQSVTLHTFANISFPEYLSTLALNYDAIENISTDAFGIFTNITRIDISGNLFNFDNLKYFLGSTTKLSNLRALALNDLQKVTVQTDLFSLMEGTRITSLLLRFNKIKSVALETFNIFSFLIKLDLQSNKLVNLTLWKLQHLQNLFLSDNNLYEFPKFCIPGSTNESFFPRLIYLDLSKNEISELTRGNLNCLPGLRHLNVDSNSIAVIPNNFLVNTGINHLKILDQNVRTFLIKRYALRSNSLLSLYLGFNANVMSVFENLDTFQFCPNLLSLGIDNIKMTTPTGELISTLFAPLTNLVYFHCFACEINQDPKYILANKPNLKTIDLPGNLIETLTSESFEQKLSLKNLRLQYNKIAHIEQSALPIKLLNKLEIIDLSNNPFTCDCNMQWFIDWTNSPENKKKISRHHWNYKCANPSKRKNIFLSEVTFSYRECHPWSPWIWAAVTAGPCLLMAAITCLVVYRNRWNIKHYIYLLRKKKQYHLIRGNNFLYNAFVGYEASDSVWVRRQLIPVLEAEQGLRLCIHERDFQAGVFINDNIVQNIEDSQKIILILTNAFAQSGWCMFELKVAHSKQIEDETEVVAILLEKIDARNMNHSLKVLLGTTTYIEWTEDAAGQELFWTKLRDAMKK